MSFNAQYASFLCRDPGKWVPVSYRTPPGSLNAEAETRRLNSVGDVLVAFTRTIYAVNPRTTNADKVDPALFSTLGHSWDTG